MLTGLDGILLGGQTECVPTHRVQDIETLHLLEAADDVGGGVAFGMANVQTCAARIREHVEHEVLGLRGIEVGIAGVRCAEGLSGLPHVLPLRFKLGKGECFALLAAHRGAEEGEGWLLRNCGAWV